MTIPNDMGNLDPSTYLCLTEVVEHPQLFFFQNVVFFFSMRLFERVEKKLCISTQDPSTYAIEDSLTTTTLAIEDSNNKQPPQL